ncbi:hypothetical protein M569_14713 [Genlisea aurea]|uniref:BSD domain-containing protein n=1 Tax=Genlisea aurea TaxID=192259 RepID=S8DKQ2_9LAMI|nr:hypothetical protein M569_14713 [Genlisea aurea]
MNFFRSVSSEPTATPSPPSSPANRATVTSSWGFGSAVLDSIAAKSASFLDNYQKDIEEFSSGFRRETSIIREAARRAVSNLPSRLESGAAVAQESLEAVGQAIDDVAELIGKELNLSSGDYVSATDGGRATIPKPYSRLEAVILALQSDAATYRDEIHDAGYDEWKSEFEFHEKRHEVSKLLNENKRIAEIHEATVPEEVDDETFWSRYFYRVAMAVKAEESRASLVKKAISSEEDEELSWDIDDDDAIGSNEAPPLQTTTTTTQASVSVQCERDGSSDGKLGSDISIVSSQRSSHAEDDEMEWHKIEGIPSGDEGKRITTPLQNTTRKKKVTYPEDEEDEELSWDLEDDDGDETGKK